MIVLLREMCEDHKRCFIIIVVGKEICEGLVREMTHPAHHPLLHRPGIRPATQHLQVVIRFHDQHIAATQMIPHADRQVAEVGGNPYLNSIRTKGESHGIGGVMRNREGLHRNVANLKAVARLEFLQLVELWPLAFLIPHCTRPRLMGGASHEDRDVQFLG